MPKFEVILAYVGEYTEMVEIEADSEEEAIERASEECELPEGFDVNESYHFASEVTK